jgi:hypothetical protein
MLYFWIAEGKISFFVEVWLSYAESMLSSESVTAKFWRNGGKAWFYKIGVTVPLLYAVLAMFVKGVWGNIPIVSGVPQVWFINGVRCLLLSLVNGVKDPETRAFYCFGNLIWSLITVYRLAFNLD